jgi:hypothetical protein
MKESDVPMNVDLNYRVEWFEYKGDDQYQSSENFARILDDYHRSGWILVQIVEHNPIRYNAWVHAIFRRAGC